MGIDLTPTEVTAIDDHFNAIIQIFADKMAINLTDKERQSVRSVAEGRKPYMDKTFDNLAPNNKVLHPGYLDFNEDQTNYNYGRKVRNFFPQAKKILEIMEDHAYSAENLGFVWMLKFYNNAKEARDTNTPGAESVVAELAPLFELTNTPAPTVQNAQTQTSSGSGETTPAA